MVCAFVEISNWPPNSVLYLRVTDVNFLDTFRIGTPVAHDSAIRGAVRFSCMAVLCACAHKKKSMFLLMEFNKFAERKSVDHTRDR